MNFSQGLFQCCSGPTETLNWILVIMSNREKASLFWNESCYGNCIEMSSPIESSIKINPQVISFVSKLFEKIKCSTLVSSRYLMLFPLTSIRM